MGCCAAVRPLGTYVLLHWDTERPILHKRRSAHVLWLLKQVGCVKTCTHLGIDINIRSFLVYILPKSGLIISSVLFQVPMFLATRLPSKLPIHMKTSLRIVSSRTASRENSLNQFRHIIRMRQSYYSFLQLAARSSILTNYASETLCSHGYIDSNGTDRL